MDPEFVLKSVPKITGFFLHLTAVGVHSGQWHLKAPLDKSETVTLPTWKDQQGFRKNRMETGLGASMRSGRDRRSISQTENIYNLFTNTLHCRMTTCSEAKSW